MFWAGAAALVIADRLESAGYAVRVIGAHVVNSKADNERRALRNDIVLKESSEPLQIDALAAVLCHAGIVRTFGFSALASIPADIGEGLGHEATIESRRVDFEAGGELPEGAIVVGAVRTREQCLAEIARVVQSLGTTE
jgi:hypothetical protein